MNEYLSSHREEETLSREYLRRIRRASFALPNFIILFFSPFFFLVSWAFFPYNYSFMILSVAFCWVLIILLLNRFYRVDRKYKEISMNFSEYLLHSNFSPTYFKFAAFTMITAFLFHQHCVAADVEP